MRGARGGQRAVIEKKGREEDSSPEGSTPHAPSITGGGQNTSEKVREVLKERKKKRGGRCQWCSRGGYTKDFDEQTGIREQDPEHLGVSKEGDTTVTGIHLGRVVNEVGGN